MNLLSDKNISAHGSNLLELWTNVDDASFQNLFHFMSYGLYSYV